MTISQGLRWSGRGFSNGRQSLAAVQLGVRHYSLNTARSSLSHTRFPRNPTPHRSPLTQQSRSISLFGWGTKSSAEDNFAKSHTPSATTPDPIQTAESLRTVKASHATSDAPDPSLPQPVQTSPTENALQQIEDSILKPHGTGASTEPLTESDLSSIPEGIGYLKDVCGLDFGWGPTAIMETVLEHLHITAGLSWGASIIAMSLIFRSALFYPFLRSASMTAKMQELKPLLQPLQARMSLASKNKDTQQALELQKEMKAIVSEAGLSYKVMFAPILAQVVFSFAAFRLLRNAGQLPVPGFEDGSILWLTSLSATDPTYLLPFSIACFTYLNMSQGMKSQPDNVVMKTMKNVFPFVSFAFMCFQPSSTSLFFLVNGIFQSFQLGVFQNKAFRKWYGLPPMPTAGAAAGAGPLAPSGAPSRTYAGMNVASTIKPKPTTPATAPQTPDPTQNRSRIDQVVDKVKDELSIDRARKWLHSATESKVEQVKAEKRATWEAFRKEELEAQRRERNRAAKQAVDPLASSKKRSPPR